MFLLSDRNLGWIALVLSFLGLVYLFIRLMIVPILPLDDDNSFKLQPPIEILVTCALCGFIFISTLAIYTVYILYRSNVDLKNVKTDCKLRK